MSNEYEIDSTSNVSWKVKDVPLSAGKLTRKVLRTEIIKNAHDKAKSVKLCLVHQKRAQESDPWADEAGTTLLQTKPLQPSKFQIDTSETRALFDALQDLYEIDPGSIGHGKVALKLSDASKVIETDEGRADLIRKILAGDHGQEVWELLVELQPNLVSKLSALRRLEARKRDLDMFEKALEKPLLEDKWRAFLKARPWLLGSTHIEILDENKMDIKNYTDIPLKVDSMFMDIVELKRPDSQFWMKSKDGELFKYRDKFLVPFWEVEAAISQVSGYVLQAEKRVDSKDFHEMHGVVPLRPRGIVVYGRSADWGEDEWKAFRLMNSRLHGVQVITFDQVLEQGRRLLEMYEADLPVALGEFGKLLEEKDET